MRGKKGLTGGKRVERGVEKNLNFLLLSWTTIGQITYNQLSVTSNLYRFIAFKTISFDSSIESSLIVSTNDRHFKTMCVGRNLFNQGSLDGLRQVDHSYRDQIQSHRKSPISLFNTKKIGSIIGSNF